MKDRYQIKCAVFLILTKKEKEEEYILLQRRYNTGILDGKFDVAASGHLEKDESLTEAMIREAKEELGIDIKKEDLKVSSTMHANLKETEYLFIVFSTDKYTKKPSIMEKDKCNELKWVNIKNLPEDIIPTRKIMIDNYLNDITYYEYGFKK